MPLVFVEVKEKENPAAFVSVLFQNLFSTKRFLKIHLVHHAACSHSVTFSRAPLCCPCAHFTLSAIKDHLLICGHLDLSVRDTAKRDGQKNVECEM